MNQQKEITPQIKKSVQPLPTDQHGWALTCTHCGGFILAREEGEEFIKIFNSESIANLNSSEMLDEAGEHPCVVRVKVLEC